MQARFEIDEDYHRDAVLKQMGALWRSSKSRLVTQINEADNNQQMMKLRPKNVPPVEWRKFVKLKTSQEFKVFILSRVKYFLKVDKILTIRGYDRL